MQVCTYIHTDNADREATVTETWHQMSPCDVFLSFVSVSFSFSAKHSPPLSPSLCQRSLCFKWGNYLIHTQDTQYQQTIFHALQHCFPLLFSKPPLPSIMRGALQRLLGTALQQQLRWGMKAFFMSGGAITWTVEGHSEEKVAFRVSELNKLYFSVLFFPVFPSSTFFSSFSPHLFYLFLPVLVSSSCTSFLSTLTCSLGFYYLALVDHRTENLVMQTAWRRHTHIYTKGGSADGTTYFRMLTHIHIHRVLDIA